MSCKPNLPVNGMFFASYAWNQLGFARNETKNRWKGKKNQHVLWHTILLGVLVLRRLYCMSDLQIPCSLLVGFQQKPLYLKKPCVCCCLVQWAGVPCLLWRAQGITARLCKWPAVRKILAVFLSQASKSLQMLTNVCKKKHASQVSASQWHTKSGLSVNGMPTKDLPTKMHANLGKPACQPRSARQLHANQGLPVYGMPNNLCS